MEKMSLTSIGKIVVEDGEAVIKLDEKYKQAMAGLDGFGYIQVVWWFDGCDNKEYRGKLTSQKPYKNGPEVMGAFATRSPSRPNPIALTTAYVTYIDYEKGIIGLGYIDANHGSPVLDIKPYTPSLDRIEKTIVPDWCAHWPKCNEESGRFNWEEEFNF